MNNNNNNKNSSDSNPERSIKGRKSIFQKWWAKIYKFFMYFFFFLFSVGIVGLILGYAIYVLSIYGYPVIFSLQQFFFLEDPIVPWIFLIGTVFALFLGAYGTVILVKKSYAFFKKREYQIPKKVKLTTFVVFFCVIAVAFTLPNISTDVGRPKKITRDQVSVIALGHPKSALEASKGFEDRWPGESYYLQAMAYSNLDQPAKSLEMVQNAVNSGLPVERFLAGPRNLFSGLYGYDDFQTYLADFNVKLIHGPVMGNITDQSASIWLRTYEESLVKVEYSESQDLSSSIISGPIQSNDEEDYTAIVNINGLDPLTTYFYKIYVDDTPINTNPFNFTTYPAEDSSSEFNVAWGGGAGYTPEHEYMWNTLDKQNLTAFLGLGDNVYIDTPEIPETQKYCYYRRQSRSEYRNFTSNVPMYAIWDDHDFGDNDCTSSTSLDEPEWKMDVLEVFKENFVNPSYGVNETNPGVFHKFSIGDVDFFMLDCRFYRQNPKKFDSPTMLGSGQKHWLKDALNQSDATFKIVASSVPWAEGTKPGSLDTWDGFPEEREEIFSFIEDEKIEGVLLLSADRHRSDAWKIERDDGYTLYDFMSSRLTNIHTHGLIDDEDMLFGYNEKCSFGLLSFNTQISDPTINYQVVNIDNVPIEGCNKTVKLSDLSYPIS